MQICSWILDLNFYLFTMTTQHIKTYLHIMYLQGANLIYFSFSCIFVSSKPLQKKIFFLSSWRNWNCWSTLCFGLHRLPKQIIDIIVFKANSASPSLPLAGLSIYISKTHIWNLCIKRYPIFWMVQCIIIFDIPQLNCWIWHNRIFQRATWIFLRWSPAFYQ